jgi:hypothetical protein
MSALSGSPPVRVSVSEIRFCSTSESGAMFFFDLLRDAARGLLPDHQPGNRVLGFLG